MEKMVLGLAAAVVSLMLLGPVAFAYDCDDDGLGACKDRNEKTGQVVGQVIGGSERQFSGLVVFIPGLSIAARPDRSGYFTLLHVPDGMHNLDVDLCDFGRLPVGEFRVNRKRVTDVGVIDLVEVLNEGQCPTDYDPVCGADRNIYSNSCEASKACVDVAAFGEECPPPPSGD